MVNSECRHVSWGLSKWTGKQQICMRCMIGASSVGYGSLGTHFILFTSRSERRASESVDLCLQVWCGTDSVASYLRYRTAT